ncbi:MAG: DUF4384 domain-containing protein [Treponema sp.]
MKKTRIKKQLLGAIFILLCVIPVFAEMTIKDVIHNFDTAVLNASIPKAEVALGFISYADTETSGTIVPWLQSEIKKAAGKTRRITIVRSGILNTQEQAGIATRGASFGKPKKAANNTFILTGIYYENQNTVELTLELSRTDGTLFASETAIIPLQEVTNRHLTLYPANKKQADSIKETVEQAAGELLALSQTQIKKGTKDEEKAPVKNSTQQTARALESDTIEVIAAMLDKDFNLVDILFPGDTVQFMICTDTDSYIAIMGIDANGNQYSLPIKNNFLQADIPRKFPDNNEIDYTVLNGVFGSEYLLIFAASDPAGLPAPVEHGIYKPETLIQAARGLAAVKKSKKIQTGIYAIPYTVMKKN